MNFIVERKLLYQSLQKIVHIVDNRPKLPIISHILLEITGNNLLITATDLEIEIVACISLSEAYSFVSSTISARKFYEICRELSERSKIFVERKQKNLIVSSDTSRFILSTFASLEFPKLSKWSSSVEFSLSQVSLKQMIELTQFSIGNQDVRHYLNGILLEIKDHTIRILAADGHRLATCITSVDCLLSSQSIIVPRKGIVEIFRLLNFSSDLVSIQTNDYSIRLKIGNYIFTSKLVDATFPNYHNIIAKKKSNNILEILCNSLKKSLKRVVILSNGKFRVVYFILTNNKLKITADNFENERSEEILDVSYVGADMKIAFNADYLIDILNVIDSQMLLRFFFIDERSGIYIESASSYYEMLYIIMPIRM